jgi:hypothetical protein
MASDLVQCQEHGARTCAFVCGHLLTAMQEGTSSNGPWIVEDATTDDPEPAAWCLDCERLLAEEGEWTDRMDEFADLRLICDRCFEPFATGGLPTA